MSNRDISDEQYIRNLAAASYPVASDIPGLPTAFRRKWVLRVERTLPVRDALGYAAKAFEKAARQLILDALGLPKEDELALPLVEAIRLGDHHLALEIDCPVAQEQKGNEAAIATMAILGAADDQWQILDIQGIPRRFWFVIASNRRTGESGALE